MLSIILNGLRIIAISDTHGRNWSLFVPESDRFIYTGDVCEDGDKDQLLEFFHWYSE